MNVRSGKKMIELSKINEIREKLPHGSFIRIQKKANVSYLTVLHFFKGKSDNIKVMKATLKIYKEIERLNSQLSIIITELHKNKTTLK